MNPEQYKEILRRLGDLEDYKKEKERQQISFPLDQQSIEVLNNYFVRIVDNIVLTFIGASAHYIPILLGQQGDKTFELSTTYIRYTADPSTDIITIVDKNQTTRFGDDEQVIFYVDLLTGDTAPGGITASTTTYYVINAASDGYSFKISASEGGAAVNITSSGVGKQFITKI